MKKIERIAIYLTIIIAFIICFTFDLKITQGLYDINNGYGKFFALAGEFPGYLITLIGACLGLKFFKGRSTLITMIGKLVFGLIFVGLAAYFGNELKDDLNRALGTSYGIWMALPFAFGYMCFAFPIGFFLSENKEKEGMKLAYVILIVFVIITLLVLGTKLIWFRPRYRTLVALYGDEAANNWLTVFKPQTWKKYSTYTSLDKEILDNAAKYLGVKSISKSDFYSFPSGHAAYSAMCLVLIFAGSTFKWIKGRELFIKILVGCFFVIVAISRIVAGAHNATDVIAGGLIGLVVVDLVGTLLRPRLNFLIELPLKERTAK